MRLHLQVGNLCEVDELILTPVSVEVVYSAGPEPKHNLSRDSLRPCNSYFSVTVIRQHNQGYL